MKKILIIIFSIMVTFSLSSCRKNKYIAMSHSYYEYFDTVITIYGYEESEEKFNEKLDVVEKLFSKYHKYYDIYYEYAGINNICTINKNAGINEVLVEQEIIDLLLFSKQMYTLTSGYTNIAMGSVLKLWHNERQNASFNPELAKLPDMASLQEASRHTNIDSIVIDDASNTVYISDKDTSIDGGAIAKGYATECIAKALKDMDAVYYTINAGGNVRSIGPKADDTSWKIGITHPDKSSNLGNITEVNIDDLTVVTSGSYQRYYIVDGVKYHHIINPSTLMPSNYYTSISIVATDSGIADALSTAIFNMPLDEAIDFIEKMDNVEAFFVDTSYQTYQTSGFASYQ